ncbi:hypothetical protein LGK97_07630 [Clostridium sp. CS001]|uniref:hypothetical protein n=1 Tax=Clostridium sp. CS001 TaxID=2880648 RepID=UPI001CF41603|nr:hypothetical protein [Clostridium sp. CS001]MCB2289633.1 hypothetical protein [Clostridium sp. CS001]
MGKRKGLEIIKSKNVQCDEAVGFKDIVAITIAQFQILMPIMIGAAVVMGLLLFIIMKIWIVN